MLRVGVRLPAAAARMGDYLADVTALEAAGADSIWLATTKSAAERWILLGAIAAVTHRVRLGIGVGSESGWPDPVDALGRLSGGRVVVGMPAGRHPKLLSKQVESRRSGSPSPTILITCETYGEASSAARLADGVVLAGGEEEVRALRASRAPDGEFELWIDAPVPTNRQAWANMIAALESAGATGIIVPWDPRIIDLLRNAGEPDDRTDLLIATG